MSNLMTVMHAANGQSSYHHNHNMLNSIKREPANSASSVCGASDLDDADEYLAPHEEASHYEQHMMDDDNNYEDGDGDGDDDYANFNNYQNRCSSKSNRRKQSNPIRISSEEKEKLKLQQQQQQQQYQQSTSNSHQNTPTASIQMIKRHENENDDESDTNKAAKKSSSSNDLSINSSAKRSTTNNNNNNNNSSHLASLVNYSNLSFCFLCKKELCNKYFLKTHLANKHSIHLNDEQLQQYQIDFLTKLKLSSSASGVDHSSSTSMLLDDEPNAANTTNSNSNENDFENDPNRLNVDVNLLEQIAMKNDDFCDLCQKQFCNKYYLKKHKMDVHGVDSNTPSSASISASASSTSQLTPVATNKQIPALPVASNHHLTKISQSSLNSQKSKLNEAATTAAANSLLDPNTLLLMNQLLMLNSPMLSPHELSSLLMSQMSNCDSLLSTTTTTTNQVSQSQAAPAKNQSSSSGNQVKSSSPCSSVSSLSSSCGANSIASSSTTRPIQPITIKKTHAEHACDLCGKVFQNSEYLAMHKRNKHPHQQSTIEPKPQIPQQQQQQQQHQQNNNNNNNSNNNSQMITSDTYCLICNKSFCNKYFLKTHIGRSHPNYDQIVAKMQSDGTINDCDENSEALMSKSQMERVVCDICNKQVCNKYFLKTHKAKVHGITSVGSVAAESLNEESMNEEPAPVHIANAEISSDLKLADDESVDKAQPLSTPQQIVSRDSYCDLCKRQFCSKYFLKSHLINMHGIHVAFGKDDGDGVVSGASAVSCHICNKELCSKYFLRQHLLNVHKIEMDPSVLVTPKKGSGSEEVSPASRGTKRTMSGESIVGAVGKSGKRLRSDNEKVPSIVTKSLIDTSTSNSIQVQKFLVDAGEDSNVYSEHFLPCMIYLPVRKSLTKPVSIQVTLRPIEMPIDEEQHNDRELIIEEEEDVEEHEDVDEFDEDDEEGLVRLGNNNNENVNDDANSLQMIDDENE